MNIWDNFFSNLLILAVIVLIIWAIIKYYEVKNENEKLKQKNLKEIEAAADDVAQHTDLAKLISDPDDFGLSGDNSKTK